MPFGMLFPLRFIWVDRFLMVLIFFLERNQYNKKWGNTFPYITHPQAKKVCAGKDARVACREGKCGRWREIALQCNGGQKKRSGSLDNCAGPSCQGLISAPGENAGVQGGLRYPKRQ